MASGAATAAIPRAARGIRAAGAGQLALLLLFVAALGYLVVVPLVRLQLMAVRNGGTAYHDASTQPRIWPALPTTVWLALGSLAIAPGLATSLAWAASTLSPRLRLLRIVPILPILLPAISSVLGWSFMFSPH